MKTVTLVPLVVPCCATINLRLHSLLLITISYIKTINTERPQEKVQVDLFNQVSY
jgi:hypothetical protein